MANKTLDIIDGNRIGLVAFGGDLPAEVAGQAIAGGYFVYPVNITGYADPNGSLSSGDWYPIGAIGKIINALKRQNCTHVCFAGKVDRPDFAKLKLDKKALRELPRVLLAATKGDDELMRAILSVFEREGFMIISPQEIADNLLAPIGPLSNCLPSKSDHEDIKKGLEVIAAIGALDIGQSAVICNGLTLAVEAQEGTSKMLRRCAALPESIRGSENARRGVLVKSLKPSQDQRVDLPTLGEKTVILAARAGLAGIAFAAGNSFLIDREKMRAVADREGLFLWGVELPN